MIHCMYLVVLIITNVNPILKLTTLTKNPESIFQTKGYLQKTEESIKSKKKKKKTAKKKIDPKKKSKKIQKIKNVDE